MTDLFNAPKTVDPNPMTVDEGKNYLEELVGEGKKFKSVEDLARGKAEADNYIDHMKKQMDLMREDLTKRLTVEEMLERINASKGTPPNNSGEPPRNEQPPTHENNVATISQEEIAKLIKQTLTVEQQKALAQQNVESVRQELIQTWGNSYPEKLDQIVRELGMTRDQAAAIAETSPKAFLKLVKGDQAPKADVFSAPPQSTVPRAVNVGGEKNYKYYQALRKSDPKLYWSIDTQREMHNLAQKMGDAFFA